MSAELAEEYGIKIGADYFGPDSHHRYVDDVERIFGNLQVKFYDSFISKTQWLPIKEWIAVNTKAEAKA